MKEHQLEQQDDLLARLTQAADDARTFTAERDRLIIEGRDLGLTLRELADAAGLSHTAIAKIDARNAQ